VHVCTQLVNNVLSGMGEDRCNHTLKEWNPFWEVDLGSQCIIAEIRVRHRSRRCRQRCVWDRRYATALRRDARPLQVWNREDSPEDDFFAADFFTGRLFPFHIFVSQEPFPAAGGKIGYGWAACVKGCCVAVGETWVGVSRLAVCVSSLSLVYVCAYVCMCAPRLEAAIRVATNKKRFYKPGRLSTFTLPFGTLGRYVRFVVTRRCNTHRPVFEPPLL
jgi:hypothetical protein